MSRFFGRRSSETPTTAPPLETVQVSIADGLKVDLPITDPEKFKAGETRRRTLVEGPEPGILFFEKTRQGIAQSAATKEEEAPKVAVTPEITPEAKVILEDERVPVITKPVGASDVHRSAYHIQPTNTVLRGFVNQELPQNNEELTPTSVKVSLGESAPVEVAVTNPDKFKAYKEASAADPFFAARQARTDLITRAEDPNSNMSLSERRVLAAQIANLSGIESPVESIEGDEAVTEKREADPEIALIPQEPVAEKPVIEKEEEMEDVCPEGEPVGIATSDTELPEEGEKEKPVATGKKGEDEAEALHEKKEKLGRKIVGADSKISNYQAKIPVLEEKIKIKEKTVNPALGESRSLSVLKRRLEEAKKLVSTTEQSLTQMKENFIQLGGTYEEIDALIQANEPEKGLEMKPIVVEEGVPEVAEEIMGAMVTGAAVAVATEALPLGENKTETATEPKENKTERVENLEEAIQAARSAYVQAEVQNTDTIKRLLVHFPFLGQKDALEENKDVVSLREKYQNLLRQHQNEELEKLTQAQSEEEKGELTKSLLKYFRKDEVTRLCEEYTNVKKERQGLGGKILGAYERMGEWYNNQSRTKKIFIGGAVYASAAAISATGGLGIGLSAGVVIYTRRLIAGAGSAIALDRIAEGWMNKRDDKKQEKQNTEDIEAHALNEGTAEERIKKLTDFLGEDIENLDNQLKKKRMLTSARKWTTRALAGGAGAWLFKEMFEYMHDPSPLTDSAPASGGLAENGPQGVPAEVPDGGTGAPSAALETVPASVGLPETYVITTEDSRAGLWGVLGKNLPENLPEADRTKTIASLQNLIANKLSHLSPIDQESLGFKGGNINTIYAGKTLQLDKLVSHDEWNQIIQGKSIPLETVQVELPVDTADVSNVNVDSVPEVQTALGENSELPLTGRVGIDLDTKKMPDNLLDQVQSREVAVTVDETPLDPTRGLLESGTVERGVFLGELSGLRQAIFVTPETSNWLRYSFTLHPELGEVRMGEVLKAHTDLLESKDMTSEIPLHQSQVERLSAFSEQAVKTYGESARPGTFESVTAYTRRLVALGFQSGSNKLNYT